MGQNELLLSLQMMVDCVEHLKHWTAVFSYRRTLVNWRKWADRSFLKFNKGKHHILRLEQNSHKKQHWLGTDWLCVHPAEKDLVLVGSKDKVSQ